MTLGTGLPEELMNIDEATGSGHDLGQLLGVQVAGEDGLHPPGRCVSLWQRLQHGAGLACFFSPLGM